MSSYRDALIAVAKQSPKAVAAHDKAAWLAIFAADYRVEDPVGTGLNIASSKQVADREPLSRFYDTFIAANDISFEVTRDLVCGNHVMRDLTLRINMTDKVQAAVPMHLLYEMVEESGGYKVARLAAHWDFTAMNQQILGKGWAALPVMAGMTRRMLKNLGWRGLRDFGQSGNTVGQPAKEQLRAFESALANRDQQALVDLFEADTPVVHLPYGEPPLAPSSLLGACNEAMSFSKLLVAGDRVTASVKCTGADRIREGVAIFKFNRQTLRLKQVTFYLE